VYNDPDRKGHVASSSIYHEHVNTSNLSKQIDTAFHLWSQDPSPETSTPCALHDASPALPKHGVRVHAAWYVVSERQDKGKRQGTALGSRRHLGVNGDPSG
jgi:hypothetical protein